MARTLEQNVFIQSISVVESRVSTVHFPSENNWSSLDRKTEISPPQSWKIPTYLVLNETRTGIGARVWSDLSVLGIIGDMLPIEEVRQHVRGQFPWLRQNFVSKHVCGQFPWLWQNFVLWLSFSKKMAMSSHNGKIFSKWRFLFSNTFWTILNRFRPKKIFEQKFLPLPFFRPVTPFFRKNGYVEP